MEDVKVRKYKYDCPKYFEGDTVRFKDHKGNLTTGTIMHVSTNYGYNFNAYHVYAILKSGKIRHLHIAERYILFVE